MTDKKTSDKKPQLVESEPVDDLEALIEDGLPYDEVDADDLIEDEAEEASSPEPVKQDSPSDSDEAEVLPKPDPAPEEKPEINEDDLTDVSDIEKELARISDREAESVVADASGESEALPDLDLPPDDLLKGDEVDQNDLSDIEKELAQISDGKKMPEAPATAEIAQHSADEASAPDVPIETAAATAMPPLANQEPRYMPKNKISKIAAALGLTGMLIAASAIWLNMSLSDQLSQLKTEQQLQKNNMASVKKLTQEVEKLKWLQNQQAEIFQSGNEAMQQQLNNLTKVVARKMTRQWRASVTTLPANVGENRPDVKHAVAPPAKTTPKHQIATAAIIPDMPPVKSAPEPRIATAAITPDVSLDQPLEQLMVATPVGNIRSIASTKGEILFQLKRGSIVSKISRTRGWIQVRLQNGKTGWGYHTLFEPVTHNPANDKPKTDGFAYELVAASAQTPAQGGKKVWAVNLVSVETETTAKKQIAYYQAMGINAEYALIPIKGKVWYRILISGFATERDAIAYKNVLARKYSISAWYSKMPPVYNR